MKLLLENWRQYLNEDEESYFPWLNDLKALGDPDRMGIEKAFPNWKKMGCGAYRCVYQPQGEKDYVVKVIRKGAKTEEEYDAGYDRIPYLTAQNKVEFDISKEFPLVFPKVYAHHPDFNWIVIDEIEVMINKSVPLMESLKVSFPKMIDYIFDIYSFQGNILSYESAFNLIMATATIGTSEESFRYYAEPADERYRALPSSQDLYNTQYKKGSMEKIFDFGIKNSETFRELTRAIDRYKIQINDIRGGNIGRTSDGRFVIIDASVWESD
jgi:hypothetical protein